VLIGIKNGSFVSVADKWTASRMKEQVENVMPPAASLTWWSRMNLQMFEPLLSL